MQVNRVMTLGVLGVAGLLAGCGGGPAMEETTASDPPPPAVAEPAPPHVGTWDLTSVELRDAAGAVLPVPDGPALGQPGAVGRLIFDDAGHFGLAIMEQGRPKFEEPPEQQALAALYGYTAMFGLYTLDDGGDALDVRFVG
ncbi:MAG: lipocalin-like domain-containing protein, partial [Acidobacteria bacterium]|nr:lipocalin-like domain-containing protein [Acidobacteriota bacterium]